MESFANHDNVFLKMPHLFKPLQVLNSVVLMICIGSTAGSDNGILWFVVVAGLLVSLAATVIFALRIQDSLMDSVSNGSIGWNVVEMIYSFVLAVLSGISVWLAFGFANRHLGGTSAGYIASGLFLILQTALYAVPCVVVYDGVRTSGASTFDSRVEAAHPFAEPHARYQDLPAQKMVSTPSSLTGRASKQRQELSKVSTIHPSHSTEDAPPSSHPPRKPLKDQCDVFVITQDGLGAEPIEGITACEVSLAKKNKRSGRLLSLLGTHSLRLACVVHCIVALTVMGLLFGSYREPLAIHVVFTITNIATIYAEVYSVIYATRRKMLIVALIDCCFAVLVGLVLHLGEAGIVDELRTNKGKEAVVTIIVLAINTLVFAHAFAVFKTKQDPKSGLVQAPCSCVRDRKREMPRDDEYTRADLENYMRSARQSAHLMSFKEMCKMNGAGKYSERQVEPRGSSEQEAAREETREVILRMLARQAEQTNTAERRHVQSPPPPPLKQPIEPVLEEETADSKQPRRMSESQRRFVAIYATPKDLHGLRSDKLPGHKINHSDVDARITSGEAMQYILDVPQHR